MSLMLITYFEVLKAESENKADAELYDVTYKAVSWMIAQMESYVKSDLTPIARHSLTSSLTSAVPHPDNSIRSGYAARIIPHLLFQTAEPYFATTSI